MAWLLVGGFGLLGTCLALLLPPFHLPDERRHWLTAQLQAERLTGGERLCSPVVALERHFRLGIHFDPERKVPPGTWAGVAALEPLCEDQLSYPFGRITTYPGVLAVRWLTPEPGTGTGALVRFFAARLLSGALILALLARAALLARRAPGGAPPLLLLLLAVPLAPLFVQQSFGVTADGVVNASGLALGLWLAFGGRVAAPDRVALIVLGLAAAHTKPVLIPVLPAVLLLGLWLEEREASGRPPGLAAALRRGGARRPLLCAGLCLVVVVGLAVAEAQPGTARRAPPIDGAAQLAFVLEDPGTALGVIAAGTARVLFDPTGLLAPLGYLDTPLRAPTRLAFAALLAVVGAAEWLGRGFRRRPVSAPAVALVLILGGSLLASVAGMGLNLYLRASPVGGDTLYGMHPRYLLPHLMVALGAAAGLLRGRLPARGLPRRARLGLTTALVVCLLALVVSTSADVLDRYY